MTRDQDPEFGTRAFLTDEAIAREVGEDGGPIRIQLPALAHVDLDTAVTRVIAAGVGPEDESACLHAWMNAQRDFVPLPAVGGRCISGFRMSGRILGSPAKCGAATPGAALVIVESPNGAWTLAIGLARREPDGPGLWRLLLRLAQKTESRLECPALPWAARFIAVAQGASAMPRIPPEISSFEVAMVSSLYRYYAFIDRISADPGSCDDEITSSRD